MKNILRIVLILGISNFISASNLQPIGGIISENVVLSVPDDFNTINEALDWLDLKSISKDSIVTIEVADGTYSNYDTIVVDHPYGRQIEIIGNTSNPSAVVLNFANFTSGVSLLDGMVLGLFDGFTMNGGTNPGDSSGISAERNSNIKCGNNVVIDGFYRGVFARWASFVQIKNSIVRNCVYTGLDSWSGSTIRADGSSVTGNGSNGVYANANGSIFIPNGSVTGNAGYSIAALRLSYIDAFGTVIDNKYASSNSEIYQ